MVVSDRPIVAAKVQNSAWAPATDILCRRAEKKNTRPSGASITTQCSGLTNRVWPSGVRATISPASLVTIESCATTKATTPVISRPRPM